MQYVEVNGQLNWSFFAVEFEERTERTQREMFKVNSWTLSDRVSILFQIQS